MAEPAVRQKLIVRNIFNGMFGKNAHPGRHIIQERIKGHVILTDKLQILVIRLMDSLDFRCSFRRCPVIIKALEGSEIKIRIGDCRAGKLQNGVYHIIGCNRLPV